MSTLQCANIWFESTANNRVQYTGSNAYAFVAGGANLMTINTSSVSFSGNLIVNSLSVSTNTATFGTAAYIVANGNVGIGNSAPVNTLSVNGTTYLGGTATVTGLITGTITTANNTTYVNGKTEGNLNVNNATTATTATNQSGGTISATSGSISGSLSVSTGNATGGGIILADDGDIVDNNDGYCSMRFSNGVRIFSANKGGSAVVTLSSSGTISDSTATLRPRVSMSPKAYNWNGATNNTVLDFTSIPSWVTRITVMISALSTNGSSLMQIRLGTASSVESSGYLGNFHILGTSGFSSLSLSSGIQIFNNAATASIHGMATIVLLNSSTNTWAFSGSMAEGGTTGGGSFEGTKALGTTLDRIRLTTVNGTDVFDAGTVNVMYE